MKDKQRLTYGRTSVYNLNYHIIWGTKYRNKVLKGHVEDTFKRLVFEIIDKYEFEIAHIEIGKDDHVHPLLSAPSKLSVTNIMRWLKGIKLRLYPNTKQRNQLSQMFGNDIKCLT